MSWRLAKGIEALRGQINARWPKRDKSSDGTIGDAAHASRSSDHNPWVRDGGQGVVTAVDISHDPGNGVDGGVIADVLVASRDPRIKYIIWNRRIVSSESAPWQWRKYTGSNPHNRHVHVSVKPTKVLYDDARPWALPGFVAPAPSVPQPKPPRPTLRMGSHGDEVRALQKRLGVAADGWFGAATQSAVKAAQRKAKLGADGIVGPYTWDALKENT